jgi:CubicO group peptidase (beta-lactamase class C family)
VNRRKFVLDLTATTVGAVGFPVHRCSSSQVPSASAPDPIKDRVTMITEQELQARLERAAAEFHLPGAAIGLIQADKTLTAVTGITNAKTRSPVVPETLFAAGSVTKVFTASLIMTYVDEGLVDLDAPCGCCSTTPAVSRATGCSTSRKVRT